MTSEPRSGGLSALASLRRLMRPRTARERCELCSLELAEDHAHLVELASRRLCCACEACAILFSGQSDGKYRRVPRGVRRLNDFRMSDVQWAGLGLPINLAFLLHSTPAGRVVAFYPSPAGATEALPPPDAWETLLEENPSLRDLEPDVEALLIHRVNETRAYYRVGVDECYKLVGLIRTHWRGMTGGTAVWKEIGEFFAGLQERSGP
jgi:hypothetical protein